MKNRSLFVLASFIALIWQTTVVGASTVKKVYFDRNLKAVEHEEFAEYYRVELYPDNTNDPITYRFYSRKGNLLAEGSATHLDAKDHSKNVYVGENISYYNNGNVAERFVLETPGALAEADYYEAYNENNKLVMRGAQNNGAFSGERFEYIDNGYVIHLFMENGIQQGEMEILVNDTVYQTTSFVDGFEDGTRTTFHPSGKRASTVTVSNGFENGIYESFDENGRIANRIPLKNGLPVGKVIYGINNMEGATTETYYEMESSSNAPLFISVLASRNEYTVSNKRLKTRSGDKISGHHDHFNILRYDLLIQNLTDKPIMASIDNIKVITFKKNPKKAKEASSRSFAGREIKSGSNNDVDLYIDEDNAREICVRHFSHESEVSYENAADIAKSAAQTTSTSFGYNTSASKNSYNRTTNTSAAALGGGASRYGAVGNGGYVFGGSVGGFAALGASSSKTSGSSSTYAYSIGTESTRSFNGAVYYQVLETEKNKVKEYLSGVKQQSIEEIERLTTSSFEIGARDYISREILASEELLDFVMLSFSINGIEYSLTLNEDDIGWGN